MNVPFTTEEFLGVFGSYNTAIWPMLIVAYLLGIAGVILAIRGGNPAGRIVYGVLAFFWLWMGVVYHIIYFSPVNPVARIFGAVFILQGFLFLVFGVLRGGLTFAFTPRTGPILGAVFVIYAMVVYPLLGLSLGHAYPELPMFGVAPCPTTIFTFGILLWSKNVIPWYFLIIPLLWSLVGMSAAINLGVPQDYGLVVAGILGTAMILMRNRRLTRPAGATASTPVS